MLRSTELQIQSASDESIDGALRFGSTTHLSIEVTETPLSIHTASSQLSASNNHQRGAHTHHSRQKPAATQRSQGDSLLAAALEVLLVQRILSLRHRVHALLARPEAVVIPDIVARCFTHLAISNLL